MGVEVRTTEAGDGINKPKSGDTVLLWYRGYIYDRQVPEKKGRQYVYGLQSIQGQSWHVNVWNRFDATENRQQDFETPLGQKKVIQGHDYHRFFRLYRG